MANSKIPLNKIVYNNKETTDYLDSTFSDIIKSENKIDTKKFFQIYKSLFYKIPKEGRNSHQTLIEQSEDYINNYKDTFSDEITRLNDIIESLYDTLTRKQSPTVEENIFYPNNTFIKYKNNANPIPVWIMQNGAKRKITNSDTLLSLKKSLGFDHDQLLDDIIQKLDFNTLANITSGPDIGSDEDINLFNFVTSDDSLTLLDLVDYTSAIVECIEGKQDDLYDLVRPVNSDGWQINGYSPNEGQNRPRREYLDGSPMNGGCIVRYYGIGLNDAGEIFQRTARIYPGESKRLYYRNTPTVNGQVINNNNRLHDVVGFVKEIRKTNNSFELTEDEYRKDEFGRVFSNLTPHLNHLDDDSGKTRVDFYDIPQETDTY
tara:strand:+ start:8262 stop:9386 length:1125 start_codon:yes stop_codon:yes gene_type:complete